MIFKAKRLKGRAAFREGSLAFSNGRDISDNPYSPSQPDDVDAWNAGWMQARQIRGAFLSDDSKRIASAEFCIECRNTTIEESSGNTYSVNGIGTKLYGNNHKCSVCGSAVASKYATILFIPVYPLGRYRVLRLPNGGFLSRLIPPWIDEEQLESKL